MPPLWCWRDAAWKSEKMSDKQWSHRLFHPLELICGTSILWRNSTVLFWNVCVRRSQVVHAASLCAAFCLHIRNTFCNENKPRPPQQGRVWTSARLPASGTTPVRGRFWTSAGMERLAVGWMSQSSRTELARDGGRVLNGFILHYYGQSCRYCVFACEGNKHASLWFTLKGQCWPQFLETLQSRCLQITHNMGPDMSLCFY